MAHQLVLGVLADGAGDRLGRHGGQLLGRERAVGAQAGLDGPEARHARRCLRSVGNQPEPKLIAFKRQRERRALLQARAFEVGRGRRLGGQRGGVRLDRLLDDADVPRAGRDLAPRRRGSRPSGSRVSRRTTSTGRCVWCRIPVETLPSTAAATEERPRLPTTITCASSSSAASSRAAKNGPVAAHRPRLGVEARGAGQLGALGGQRLGLLAPGGVEVVDHRAARRRAAGRAARRPRTRSRRWPPPRGRGAGSSPACAIARGRAGSRRRR